MKPREFVSRVISLYDFSPFHHDNINSQPTSFIQAAALLRKNHEHTMVVNGIYFKLCAGQTLGHTVIRAEMLEEVYIVASIAFAISNYDIVALHLSHDDMLESWNICPDKSKIDSMLVMLTLLSDYEIKTIFKPIP